MASRTPTASASRSVSSGSLPTRHTTPVVQLSPAEKEKEGLIRAAIDKEDISALVDLATSSSGLVSDNLRCTAWPLLLGCDKDSGEVPWADLPEYKDEEQVEKDVNRAFVNYPDEPDRQKDKRKVELSNVILDVLRRHPTLCYFQGYHDIAQVFLLVLGAQDAPAACARLTLLRLRDFMVTSLDPALAQLELLRPILRAADPDLYNHLTVSQPSSGIAHTITMFAHKIEDYKDITRLFDFFLARHAVMPIYLFAAVVLSKRDELLEIEQEDGMILSYMLPQLPQPFDVEFFIARAMELYERLPPASLNSWEWWRISSYSVLKSSATISSLQRLSLEDGEALFTQQEKEMRRQKAWKANLQIIKHRLWYYRRYGAVGLAIIVGAYAVWLGRSSGLGTRYPLFGPIGEWMRRYLGAAA